MANDLDRLIKGQSAFDRAVRGESTATDLIARLQREDRLTQLRAQAATSASMIGSAQVQKALEVARSDQTIGMILSGQAMVPDTVGELARREIAFGNMRRISEELAKSMAPLKDIGERFAHAKLASDINASMTQLVGSGRVDPFPGLRDVADTFSRMFRDVNFEEARSFANTAAQLRSINQPIRDAIERINGPWARVGAEMTSIAALGSLSAISRAVNGEDPFGSATTKLLRDQLGDWRKAPGVTFEIVDPLVRTEYYDDRGFDHALTDFPAEVAEQVLEIVEAEPIDAEAELRADQAYQRISRFERRLRAFIDRHMRAAFGDGWERARLPKDVIEDWEEKHQGRIDAGAAPHALLIEYADFRHYEKIICGRSNWREVFGPMFRRKSDIEESLIRLAPVRLATMHSELVTIDDELLVRVETTRMLNAIARLT